MQNCTTEEQKILFHWVFIRHSYSASKTDLKFTNKLRKLQLLIYRLSWLACFKYAKNVILSDFLCIPVFSNMFFIVLECSMNCIGISPMFLNILFLECS